MKKFLILLSLVSSFAWASSCPQFYPNKTEIAPVNSVELCNSFFVTRYNVDGQYVVFSSELLHDTHVRVPRSNDFHADTRIPIQHRVTPEEYRDTGFDKGHMAPAADATTDKEMSDTFLMTNMSPQQPTLNRGSWKMLEELVRHSVNGDVWVITIAEYDNNTMMKTIPVPTGYWKVVFYDGGHIDYYYADNKPHATVQKVKIDDFYQWYKTKNFK